MSGAGPLNTGSRCPEKLRRFVEVVRVVRAFSDQRLLECDALDVNVPGFVIFLRGSGGYVVQI